MFRPLFTPGRIAPSLCNHSKIIIRDGRIGFAGGMNVGEEYRGRHGKRGQDWFDLHVEIRGPAVLDLQRIFIEDRDFCTGKTIDDPAYFPRIEPAGGSSVQIISGGPDVDINPIRQDYFTSFIRARRSIVLTTPHVVSDRGLRDALRTAALAGVAVHVVSQAPPPDLYLLHYCGLYYVEELIEAGVRFYQRTPGMTHARAVVVDAEWAMIGTAKLDNRSMSLNFEQMAILDGKLDVQDVEASIRSRSPAAAKSVSTISGACRTANACSWRDRVFSTVFSDPAASVLRG